MRYKTNLKIQIMYAVVTFALSFLILYLFTKQIDWITPSVIGVFEFVLAGFLYTTKPAPRKKKK